MNTPRTIAKLLPLAVPLSLAGMITGCAGEGSTGDVVQIQQKSQTTSGFIAVFESGVSSPRGRALELASSHSASVGHVYRHAIRGFSFNGSATAAQKIAANTDVAFVEPDGVAYAIAPKWCADDPDHPACKDDDGGDGGGGGGQVTPWGITRVGGPVDGTSAGTAWIIDTGVDLDHPDLNVDSRSANFVSKGKNTADDGNGHGTHVAGTIAAIDNNTDVVGVAAGAPVVGVRVLDNRGSGSFSDIIAGVDYVAANASPGDVANMSLGGQSTSTALDDAVKNAADQGILFAIAAGNDSDDANNYTPARVEHANVRTVSAIDDTDAFAYFSNFGNPPIDFAAPGVDILSTWKDGATNTISGTSMAAPHVAGLLLLGPVSTDGTASGDPDGDADPIAHN